MKTVPHPIMWLLEVRFFFFCFFSPTLFLWHSLRYKLNNVFTYNKSDSVIPPNDAIHRKMWKHQIQVQNFQWWSSNRIHQATAFIFNKCLNIHKRWSFFPNTNWRMEKWMIIWVVWFFIRSLYFMLYYVAIGLN